MQSKGQFQPGVSGNRAGRPPKVKSKVINNIINTELERLPVLLSEMKGRDRVEMIIKLIAANNRRA